MFKVAVKEEVDRIREILETKGKKILFTHRDADGICAGALLLKFFPDFECVIREGPRIEHELVEEIIEKAPKAIVFLDLPVDQEYEKIKTIEKELPGTKILIVDHHIPEKNLGNGNTIHINPMFREKIYLPASYLVYQIMEDMKLEAKKYIWIGAIGVIGDYGFEDCSEFLDRCRKVYPELLFGHPLMSKMGRGAQLISAAITLKGLFGANKAMKALLGADDFDDFAMDREIISWFDAVRKEINRILLDFDENKEEYKEKGVIIYKLKSRLNIASVISTILAQQNQEDVIIIRKKTPKGEWKLSLRDQKGRVNLGRLVKESVKGIGSGGGHEKAAGALVSDWDAFKKNFISGI